MSMMAGSRPIRARASLTKAPYGLPTLAVDRFLVGDDPIRGVGRLGLERDPDRRRVRDRGLIARRTERDRDRDRARASKYWPGELVVLPMLPPSISSGGDRAKGHSHSRPRGRSTVIQRRSRADLDDRSSHQDHPPEFATGIGFRSTLSPVLRAACLGIAIAIAVAAAATGAHAAPRPAPMRVVLADPDPELSCARSGARSRRGSSRSSSTPRRRATRPTPRRAPTRSARFVVWRRGGALVVLDRERGSTEERDTTEGPLDPVGAASAALTVKTLMRLPPPPPDESPRDGAERVAAARAPRPGGARRVGFARGSTTEAERPRPAGARSCGRCRSCRGGSASAPTSARRRPSSAPASRARGATGR